MNKSSHKPIFGADPKKTPPRNQPPPNQPPPNTNGGGRSANIIIPAQNKKMDLSSLGSDCNVSPFSGYNSQVSQSKSLSSSRVYENPKENPMMQSFVKETVAYEVNERYKILIDRNQKLEEQLSQSSKRIEQLESSFMQSQSELQSINNTMDLSEINSAIGNNQQIEELTSNYSNIKNNVDTLQKQLNDDIKQQVQTTIEGIQQKDIKMQSVLEQMNQKYEQKLNLIEQQLKVFSTSGNETNEHAGSGNVGEKTVKRLEAEQLQVQSELQQIKFLMETIKNDSVNLLNSQIDEKIKNFNKEFDDLKKSIANVKTELESKIDILDGSQIGNDSMRQSTTGSTYQKQIEDLTKSIKDLQVKQTANPSEIEKENRELKEKFTKYQRETGTQIEELRRLVLSNPEMMMEASKGSFRRQTTYDQISGELNFDSKNIDDQNFQMFNNLKNNRQMSDQDQVEIATFGSMSDSKASNADYGVQRLKEEQDSFEFQKSMTFGGKGGQGQQVQNENKQEEDWLKQYSDHAQNVNELLNKYGQNNEIGGGIQVTQQNNLPEKQQQNPQGKKYSYETPERENTDSEMMGDFGKTSFDDMKINYDGIRNFLNQQGQQPGKDLLQSEVSLQSETSHDQILDSLGYKNQGTQGSGDNTDIKMIQSTMSVDQSSSLNQSRHKKSDVVVGEIEEEEGETMVFDQKTKRFSPLKTDNSKSDSLTASQMKIQQQAENMRRSQINEQKQLFEVNVHDLEFTDTNVSKYFNDRSSLDEMSYNIMVTDPDKQNSKVVAQTNSERIIKELTTEQTQNVAKDSNKSEEDHKNDMDELNPSTQEQRKVVTNQNPSDDNNDQQYIIENKKEYVLSNNQPTMQESQITDAQENQFGDEEEEEIVYQLDENGFLMDEKGNYILGDDGEMVKLGEDDIQYLRQTNMLEED